MITDTQNFKENKLIEEYFKNKDYKTLINIATKSQSNNSHELNKSILERLYKEKYKDAYYHLALIYIFTENNIEKGVHILEEASEFNCLDSLKFLGNLYFTGIDVEENYKKAVFYYEKAALFNDKDSIENLSIIYLYDMESYQSSKSLDILNRGKNLNIKASILCLSEYYKKNGVDWDMDLSLKYREDCLDENNIEEVKNLALEYLKRSSSTNKYFNRMVELFEKASNHNDIDSINLLGYFYYKGRVVPEDLNKSLEYYNKALLLGDSTAQREINIVKNKMEK